MPKTLPALCCGAWWRQRWQEVLRPRLPLALVSTGLSMLFTHYLFLVNGYTGPDGLCEGLLWATNLNWNIRLGRWLMAWSREASLSLVLPAIFFAANTVAIALAVLLLADLWKVKGRAFVVWGASPSPWPPPWCGRPWWSIWPSASPWPCCWPWPPSTWPGPARTF